jgi:hypothetical protein
VCKEDAASDERAVKDGPRILSSFAVDPTKPIKGFGDNTLRIITESDRSATTIAISERILTTAGPRARVAPFFIITINRRRSS